MPTKLAHPTVKTSDHPWAAYVAYVKAHPGMLDALAQRDPSFAAFLVAQSRSMDATPTAPR